MYDDKCNKQIQYLAEMFGKNSHTSIPSVPLKYALQSLIAEYNVNKNFNYNIYTNLFETYIAHVVLYGSEACGHNVIKNINKHF